MRWLVIAITVGAAVARADPEKAKELAGAADDLVAKGDLVGAGAKFREAYREDPRPEHMCNAGVAYHKANDLSRSHRYLSQCVTMGASLDAAYRENLKKVVEATEGKLVAGDFTPIDIGLDPPTAVVVIEGGKPYDEEIIGGGRIWVPFGTYRFAVRADGYVPQTLDVKAEGHGSRPFQATLAKAPIAVPEPTLVPGTPPSKAPAVIASGATVGLGVAAILFYLRARGFNDDAESPLIYPDEYKRLRDKAKANQHISWGFAGAAAAGAALSAFLWYRALKAPPMIEVAPTTNGASVSFTRSF